MRKRTRRLRKTRLQSQIEVVQENERTDSADTDVLPYVDKLIQELQALPPMEQFSLLSPEDAQRALGMIDNTLKHLNSQLAVARSLQTILKEKKRKIES